MSEEEGTYLTSLEVIKQIDEWKGIPYIAHFIFISSLFSKSKLNLSNIGNSLLA